MSELPRFEEGDTISFRGNTYTVEDVAIVPKYDQPDKLLHYDLDAVDGPPATLEPAEDSFVVKEFHEVDPENVEVENE